MTARTTDFQPVKGDFVHDTHLDRPAVYMGQTSPFRWCLRPVGGGLEWDADPGDVRPADREDDLRGRVGALNNSDSVWTR